MNIIFPLVRKMHERWGTYGNVSLLMNLTVRDLIKSNRMEKERARLDDERRRSSTTTKEQINHALTFPVFTMFGRLAPKSHELVMAMKATLFKKHADPMKQKHANRVGELMLSLTKLHEKMFEAFSDSEDDKDLHRLNDMCIAQDGAEYAILDAPLVRALESISEMTINVGKRAEMALVKMISHLINLPNDMSKADENEARAIREKHISVERCELLSHEARDPTSPVKTQSWVVVVMTEGKLEQVMPLHLEATFEIKDDELSEGDDVRRMAEVRGLSLMLNKMVNFFWTNPSTLAELKQASSSIHDTQVDFDDGTQPREKAIDVLLKDQLLVRKEKMKLIIKWLVMEGSDNEIDNFDTAYEGLRMKRVVTA